MKTEAQIARKRERERNWRLANPERARAYDRKKYENPERRIRLKLAARRRNGVPEPLYPAPATCECCKRAPGIRPLVVDHDHATGAFRGWLCDSCNLGLGKLGDNIDGVMRAVRYLQRMELV